jgi:hypothetical protein
MYFAVLLFYCPSVTTRLFYIFFRSVAVSGSPTIDRPPCIFFFGVDRGFRAVDVGEGALLFILSFLVVG